jgi:hypothetical protein
MWRKAQEMHMSIPKTPAKPSNSYTLMGFLAMCFAIVGLVGLFASFATPLPLYRALARDTALDAALVAMHGPNPQAALEALQPRLDDSAAAFTPLPANPDAAVAAERTAMHARFVAEANATASRMQLMIGIVTVMSAVFGAAIIGFGKR